MLHIILGIAIHYQVEFICSLYRSTPPHPLTGMFGFGIPLGPACGFPVALFLLLWALSPPLHSVPFPPQQGPVVFIHWIPGPSCWIPVALFLLLSLIVHIFKRSRRVSVLINQGFPGPGGWFPWARPVGFLLHCSYSSRPSLLPSVPYLYPVPGALI